MLRSASKQPENGTLDTDRNHPPALPQPLMALPRPLMALPQVGYVRPEP